MRAALVSLVLALAGFAAPAASAAPADFTHEPFAARSGGSIGVSFTFRRSAREPKLTFAGRSTRVQAVDGAPKAFYAIVSSSRGLRVGRTYPMTLSWRGPAGRRSVSTRLFLHRRFPGGRGEAISP